VDDARLVVLHAIDAAERGAVILPRTACVEAKRQGGAWIATLTDEQGQSRIIRACAIVNATGPWAAEVQGKVLGGSTNGHLRLVQGSHIVVPKLFEGEHAYILQNPDKRIAFAIPYEGRFTLIGTTDIPYEGDPARVRISEAETAYLCASVSQYFTKPVSPSDVVWTYSGVRPLYDDAAADPSAITRDYVFELSGDGGQAPLLTIFGGKLTTYRGLAESALEKLATVMPIRSGNWTAGQSCPAVISPKRISLNSSPHSRPTILGSRNISPRATLGPYGPRARLVLDDAERLADLGHEFGAGLYQREVEYLMAYEWARETDDILLRCSKLALHGGPELRAALNEWLARRDPRQAVRVAAAV
jgi:glycerol-3-phosphate dehydrogenase